MKTFDLHSTDLNIVEKKKIWFAVPAAVLAIAVIMGIIFGFTMNGNVMNLGMDFTGGYTLTVKLGSSLEDDAYRTDAENAITQIIEHPNATAPNSEAMIEGLQVHSILMQGEGADQALNVRFTAGSYSQSVMTGDTNNDGILDVISDLLAQRFFADDPYSGNIGEGNYVSASISSELLITAICGIIMALALMLIYIAIRFELLSGIVAMICLVHDIGIMFLFMMIFHIPITSTFVAALITILGYSINNTIIIFDKVRDLVKTAPSDYTPSKIANTSVRDTMVRSINTTATTFITIFMVWLMSAIFGVADLVNFCLPLMAGLVAGTFSSLLLAPSIWAMWKSRAQKKVSVTTLPPVEEEQNDGFLDGLSPEDDVAEGKGESSPEAADAAVTETPADALPTDDDANA